MKKLTIFILAFALLGVLFTGCRGRNEVTTPTDSSTTPSMTDTPTLPSAPQTQPTTEATTEATTDVTTTPTDGMVDPTDNSSTRGANGNPSTGDSGMSRLIPGME